jgi:hypothetical protein
VTAATLTLADFLLARIAEDEAAVDVRSRIRVDYWTDAEQDACDRVGSARVLAECEARRKIVGRYTRLHETVPVDPGSYLEARAAVRYLAAVYADHPDYREEWRP